MADRLRYSCFMVEIYVEPDDPRLDGMWYLDDKVDQLKQILEVFKHSFEQEKIYLEVTE